MSRTRSPFNTYRTHTSTHINTLMYKISEHTKKRIEIIEKNVHTKADCLFYTQYFLLCILTSSLLLAQKNNQASNLAFEDVKWFMVLCPFDTLPMYTYVCICKYIS